MFKLGWNVIHLQKYWKVAASMICQVSSNCAPGEQVSNIDRSAGVKPILMLRWKFSLGSIFRWYMNNLSPVVNYPLFWLHPSPSGTAYLLNINASIFIILILITTTKRVMYLVALISLVSSWGSRITPKVNRFFFFFFCQCVLDHLGCH